MKMQELQQAMSAGAPVQEGRLQRQRDRAKKTLVAWISGAMIAITLYMLGGVIGGVALAVHTTQDDYFSDPTHPFIGFGLGIVGFVIVTWAVTMAVLNFLLWKADQ